MIGGSSRPLTLYRRMLTTEIATIDPRVEIWYTHLVGRNYWRVVFDRAHNDCVKFVEPVGDPGLSIAYRLRDIVEDVLETPEIHGTHAQTINARILLMTELELDIR